MLSGEVVSRILEFTWVHVGDLAPQLLVSKGCWCNNIILPTVPEMILRTSPNLDKLGVAFSKQREDRLIQAHQRDHDVLLDLAVYRQVVRLQICWARMFAGGDRIILDLLVDNLLRTLHASFVRWRPLVVRKALEEMGAPEAETLGEMTPPSKINNFNLWWRRSTCDIFEI